MLDAIRGVLSSQTVIAIVSDKTHKPRHEAYLKIDRFNVGHRLVTIFIPANNTTGSKLDSQA
jgi:hypothetical protein